MYIVLYASWIIPYTAPSILCTRPTPLILFSTYPPLPQTLLSQPDGAGARDSWVFDVVNEAFGLTWAGYTSTWIASYCPNRPKGQTRYLYLLTSPKEPQPYHWYKDSNTRSSHDQALGVLAFPRVLGGIGDDYTSYCSAEVLLCCDMTRWVCKSQYCMASQVG
jgi:hypothetical protein